MKRNDSAQHSLRSGQLAKLAGVSTDTLRHYERKRVLPRPHRRANGYRDYPPEALERVRMIRRALAVGFTLDELAEVLGMHDKGVAPCRRVRELAAAKLNAVEEQIREMLMMRDALCETIVDWDNRLAKAGKGERASLLYALASSGESDRIQPATRSRALRGKAGRAFSKDRE